MNMFYYHWLIKKLLQPIAGQNIARLEEIERERVGRVRESEKHHVAAEGERDQQAKTLPVGHSLVMIHRLIERS